MISSYAPVEFQETKPKGSFLLCFLFLSLNSVLILCVPHCVQEEATLSMSSWKDSNWTSPFLEFSFILLQVIYSIS